MIISFIAVLLLAGKVLSSLSFLVQGSISINNDTILLDLTINKLSGGDDMFNETIAKLQMSKVKPGIHLMINMEEQVIKINGGIDDVKFDKVTDMVNDPRNIRVPKLREISCITCNDARRKIIASRPHIMNKLIDDISHILQHVALVMQKHNDSYKKLIYEDLSLHENFRFIVPQGYQKSRKTPMKLNQESEYIASPQIFSSDNFSFEKERFNLDSKLFLEYLKAVQNGLLWLTKLFDVKWRQSYDFDNTLIWRLLHLQKQAEFLLENLIEKNQRQYDETKNKKYQDFTKDRSINDILNAEEINEKDKQNLNKTDKIETSKNEIQKIDYKLTNSEIMPNVETRIMNYPELLKEINSHDLKDKSFTTIKINPINQKFTINKFSEVKNNSMINDIFPPEIKVHRDKNLIIGKTSLVDQGNYIKSTKTPHNKSLVTGFENRFSQLKNKNKSTILSSENITNILKEQQKQTRMDDMLHKSLKKNETKVPFRRTLQNILIPSTLVPKNEDQKQKNQHVSKKKIADNHHRSDERVQTKIDSASAMDEILEAVGEVLPTDRSVESPSSRELKMTL